MQSNLGVEFVCVRIFTTYLQNVRLLLHEQPRLADKALTSVVLQQFQHRLTHSITDIKEILGIAKSVVTTIELRLVFKIDLCFQELYIALFEFRYHGHSNLMLHKRQRAWMFLVHAALTGFTDDEW